MPCVIGDFISENVYHSQLSTFHNITDPKACRFIDIKGGNEAKQGHSWVVSLVLQRRPAILKVLRTVEKL